MERSTSFERTLEANDIDDASCADRPELAGTLAARLTVLEAFTVAQRMATPTAWQAFLATHGHSGLAPAARRELSALEALHG
jgi:hypothetical protein